MNKLIDKLIFSIRMAFKNIIYFKFRSLILLLTFTILLILSLFAFSTKPFLTHYFFDEKLKIYQDIDFYLTYDQNTKSRYFSIRELNNRTGTDDFDSVASFFLMSTLMETQDDSLGYVDIMASTFDELKKVTSVEVTYHTVKANEIIISESISEQYDAKIGDTLYLRLGPDHIPFKVIDVFEVNGLFRENNVFIDKDSNMGYFLKAYGLTNINPIFTKNIFNRVYFSLSDESKKKELQEHILSIPEYKNFVLEDTIEPDMIQESVTKVGSILFLVFSFVLLAIILVLQSTLRIIFEERKEQIGVTTILGGRRRFLVVVLSIEIMIYMVCASLLAIAFTHSIINNGLKYIGSTFHYQMSINQILLSIIFVIFMLFGITFLNFFKVSQTSLVELSRANVGYEHKKPVKSILGFVLCLIGYLANYYILKDYLPIKYFSLINVAIAIGLLFTLARVILLLINFLVHKFSKTSTFFSLFTLKNINQNRLTHRTLDVLLTSFALIVLLIGANTYVNKRIHTIKDNFRIDYGITNVIHQVDSTYNTLKADTRLANVDKAYFYTDVKVDELDSFFWGCVSLDPNHINDYFKMNLSQDILDKLHDEHTPYSVIPIKYKYLNDLKVGDIVTLSINQMYTQEKFVIAGFSEWESSEIILTNINTANDYREFEPNAILLNYKEDHPISKRDLIELFDKEQYYILEFESIIDREIDRSMKVTQYMSYIIIVMVSCFMLTIFNNSALEFSKMKPIYSRLKVLGCSNRRLIFYILIEKMLILLTAIVSMLTALYLIQSNIQNLLLFFGTFEYFRLTNHAVLTGIGFGTIIYIVSSTITVYKVKRIMITNVLKSF